MRCIETRKTQTGFVRRVYLMPDGTKRTTYEVGEDLVLLRDLRALINRAAAARNNLKPKAFKFLTDPDVIDGVLEDLDAGKTMREIAKSRSMSTKTVQRIKHGVR